MYVTPQGRTRFDKVHELDAESRHLVLLCRNEEGYRNLSYLVSPAGPRAFTSSPGSTWSCCGSTAADSSPSGPASPARSPGGCGTGSTKNAKAYALELSHIFGPDHFYLELQDHGIPVQAT